MGLPQSTVFFPLLAVSPALCIMMQEWRLSYPWESCGALSERDARTLIEERSTA